MGEGRRRRRHRRHQPYAQEQLGDVVLSNCPKSAKAVAKGKELAVVESVKAARKSTRRSRRHRGREGNGR